MSSYYTYFISSLPMLQFGSKPALTLKDFLNRCAEFIPRKDAALIKEALSTDGYALKVSAPAALLKWREFDLALRNELVKARALRKKVDPAGFLRNDTYFDMKIIHIAQAALRHTSVLEAERYLDLERWNVLDEISRGHYFDLDFLLAYGLKLAILERWAKIEAADKAGLLEKAIPN
ncbi:MAG: DUF2764 family protein [Candidatus Omnitrophica bacterium]|nr:DUF2764 family protein [Candidatus Omnitrophota bacterium]